MRKVLTPLLVLLTFQLMCLHVSAVSIVDVSAITIIPFDYEQTKSGNVEEVCYPSGLQLPTKYCDFMDYVPYSEGTHQDLAAGLLNTLHPECEGKFTYPEYMAAKRFVFLTKSCLLSAEEAPYRTNIEVVMAESEWSLGMNFSNVQLGDTTRFCNALSIYQDLLQSTADGEQPTSHQYWELFTQEMGEGFYLTTGSVNFYDYEPLDCVDTELMSGITCIEYISQLPKFWSYLGCSIIPTAMFAGFQDNSLVISSEHLADSVLSILGVEVVTSEKGASDTISETNEPIPEKKPEVKPTEETPYVDVTKDSDIVSIDLKATGVMKPVKAYNARDVISITAFIFVTIAVIVLWIINTIRKRKDPLYKWLR